MQKVSVVIITFNEERNICRCIDSVREIADEIIVLDSFSTDNTVTLARNKGAIVTQQKFPGYIEQKNAALTLASHPFVLSLDADEAIDGTLAASLQEARKEFRYRGYSMNRSTNYCGRFIRHGSWYPDRKLRLFDKTIARWGGLNPHDKIELEVRCPVKHLKGDILHYCYATVEEHIEKNARFSSIAASSLHQIGKKSTWFHILFHPFWEFFNGYILRMGFLDGRYGFIIAKNAAHLTFMKYIKLYELQKNK